jgi:hypothetical protein
VDELRIDHAANQCHVGKKVPAFSVHIRNEGINPIDVFLGLVLRAYMKRVVLKPRATKQSKKLTPTHNSQLPKKLILTRKLTILSERKCHFLKFKVKKLTTKSSFTLLAHASGAK